MRTLRAWAGETVGGLPSSFWFLWLGTLISRVAAFALIVMAVYLTHVRGLSESFAGFVIGLWGGGGAIGTLVGGVLTDRWGRKPTLLTASYANAALLMLLGFVHSPVAIALTVFALGAIGEAARPAQSALMIDVVPERDRVRAFSLNYWVINLGFSFAAITAGLLANVDYTLLFALNALANAAAATLIAIKVPEPAHTGRGLPRPTQAGPNQAGSDRAGLGATPELTPAARVKTADGGLRSVFADRVFLTFLAANVLTALVFLQHISTLPMAMTRDNLPIDTFGRVIALNGVLIVVGQLFIPRLIRGQAHATVQAIAALILGVGFGLTALAHTPLAYAATVLIWTVGEMLNAPASSATNAELSPVNVRGRYQGAFSLSWAIAGFGAGTLGSVTLQHFGAVALWLGCLALGLITASIHMLSGPSRVRRAAALSRYADAAAQITEPASVEPTPAVPLTAKPLTSPAA